jgi:hypothetical protein
MLNKKLLTIGVAALSLTTASAFADTLTLKNQNISSPIQVSCNNKTGLPIPAMGQLGPLKYVLVQALFGSHSISCTFTINGTAVGKAKLFIGPTSQQAQVLSYTAASGYSVTINPSNAITTPVSDMTVTLAQQ